MSIQKITRDEEASLGVSSLPNRPSAPSLYSGEAMTASELRAAFDRLPLLVAERLNALIDATGLYEEGKEADTLAALIATRLAEGHSLEDLFADIGSGAFAGYLSVGESGVLQDVLNDLKAVVSLPNGFSDLRTYVDSPGGNVEKDNPLPVSGGKVFAHTDKLKTQLSARIPSITGEVKAGDALAVSGDKVFQALGASAAPLDARISTIEGVMDGMPFHFNTVTTEEGRSFTPDGAMRYARLDHMEGYTRKSENLLKFLPGSTVGEAKSIAHAYYKATIDANGYFTLNSDGNTEITGDGDILGDFFSEIPDGAKVTLTVEYVSGVGHGFDGINDPFVQFGWISWSIPCTYGAKYTNTFTYHQSDFPKIMHFNGDATNLKYAVMLSLGEQEKPFEPYFEGVRNAKITEIKSRGKNLLDTASGVNECLSDNGDGTYTFTKTDSNYFSKQIPCNIPKGSTITLHAKIVNTTAAVSTVRVQLRNNYLEVATLGLSDTPSTVTLNKDVTNIRFYSAPWSTVSDATTFSEPQIEYGSTKTEYTPYVDAVDAYAIPKEVQALDPYGVSLNAYRRNYIDFGRKAYCQPVACVDLGTLDWQAYSSYFVADLPVAGKPTLSYEVAVEAVCSAYDTLSQAELYENKKGVAIQPVTATGVSLCDPSYTDATALKAALSGVTLMYEAKESTMVDLAEHIPVTPYLEVERGGYLEAITEDGTPAPFTVTYQIKNES